MRSLHSGDNFAVTVSTPSTNAKVFDINEMRPVLVPLLDLEVALQPDASLEQFPELRVEAVGKVAAVVHPEKGDDQVCTRCPLTILCWFRFDFLNALDYARQAVGRDEFKLPRLGLCGCW